MKKEQGNISQVGFFLKIFIKVLNDSGSLSYNAIPMNNATEKSI
jgi:hypothetical protein